MAIYFASFTGNLVQRDHPKVSVPNLYKVSMIGKAEFVTSDAVSILTLKLPVTNLFKLDCQIVRESSLSRWSLKG